MVAKMVRPVKCLLTVGTFILQTSCVQSDRRTEMYICVKGPRSSSFTAALGIILQRRGFKTAIGRAVDEAGRTNRVLEASRGLVRVWAQNSPAEPPAQVADGNSYSPGLSVNPAEYYVTVQPRFPFLKSGVRRTFEEIRRELRNAGYRVSRVEGDC